MGSEPAVIYSARTSAEAHLLKNLLAETGIEAQVDNEEVGNMLGLATGSSFTPRVTVDEKDVAEARQIAEEFDRQVKPGAGDGSEAAEREPAAPSVASAPWPTCPECGTRRMAVCPACHTQGDAFPAADADPESGAITPGGDGAVGPAAASMLICTECDEAFAPVYLRQCRNCAYQFEPESSVPAPGPWWTRPQVVLWLAAAAIVVVVLIGMGVFSRP